MLIICQLASLPLKALEDQGPGPPGSVHQQVASDNGLISQELQENTSRIFNISDLCFIEIRHLIFILKLRFVRGL